MTLEGSRELFACTLNLLVKLEIVDIVHNEL
jgi:hypothetical protein